MLKNMIFLFFSFILIHSIHSVYGSEKELIKVGSKNFTESYILSEIVSQIIENELGINVERKFGLGGTGIIYKSLKNEEIDLYVEYTGTLIEFLVKGQNIKTINELRIYLEENGMTISKSLGFNNSYAIVIKKELAEQYNIKKISDLKYHSNFRAGFSYEFMDRDDGFYSLSETYGLKFDEVKEMNHSLSYEAINKGQIDLMDGFYTDPKIEEYDLQILNDDYFFFNKYNPVIIINKSFLDRYPHVWKKLKEFENKITNTKMMYLNSLVETHHKEFDEVANEFLNITHQPRTKIKSTISLFKLFTEHLYLVFVCLFFSFLIGFPCGVFASRNRIFAHVVLILSGTLQSIPALAFLGFLVPLVGIGKVPSLITLFCYALLPIISSVYAGLKNIDRELKDMTKLIGLSFIQSLWKIEIPLALKTIISGIKTSSVISVGNATLVAFIGGGGLGTLIFTGISTNNSSIILKGALPAALMAIFFYIFFEYIEYKISPHQYNDNKKRL